MEDEVTGCWRKLHNGELHNSQNIVRIIKSRRMRMSGAFSTHWGDKKCIQNFG
jgi:hypothetical protein